MILHGIDVSSYQPANISSTVPTDYVIVKATQGVNYVSDTCDAQFQGALKAGRLAGVYHFANGGDAIAEADFFVKNVKGYIRKGILVLDWEGWAISRGPGWAKQWLDRVYAKTGVRPLIYMSTSVASAYDWSAVVKANYGLWAAEYGANNPTGHRSPSAPSVSYWPFVATFQYGSKGQLSGYSGYLDMDVFYGNRDAWNAYAGVKPAKSKPAAPAAPTLKEFIVNGFIRKTTGDVIGTEKGKKWLVRRIEWPGLAINGAKFYQCANAAEDAEVDAIPDM